jgi:hypothetical protein
MVLKTFSLNLLSNFSSPIAPASPLLLYPLTPCKFRLERDMQFAWNPALRIEVISHFISSFALSLSSHSSSSGTIAWLRVLTPDLALGCLSMSTNIEAYLESLPLSFLELHILFSRLGDCVANSGALGADAVRFTALLCLVFSPVENLH